MNKIFKQEYSTLSFTKQEKEELSNLNFYAIDNHITKETKTQDDYIAFYKEWCILVTFKTSYCFKDSLIKYIHSGINQFELEFKKSGGLSRYNNKQLVSRCISTHRTLIYFININNPKRVYLLDNETYSGPLKNANSFLEQQEALAEFKENSIYIDKILNSMNTTTFVQNGDFKKESDINKLVRFANSNLNKFVRNKVEKHLKDTYEYPRVFEKCKFLIGASSPKRNIIHNIVNTFNDLDILCHYLIAKEDELEKYTNETNETRDKENISMFKCFMKKHPVILKAYNHYDSELYVMCNGVHIALHTEYSSWYEDYDKYDSVTLYDLYKYTNIKEL